MPKNTLAALKSRVGKWHKEEKEFYRSLLERPLFLRHLHSFFKSGIGFELEDKIAFRKFKVDTIIKEWKSASPELYIANYLLKHGPDDSASFREYCQFRDAFKTKLGSKRYDQFWQDLRVILEFTCRIDMETEEENEDDDEHVATLWLNVYQRSLHITPSFIYALASNLSREYYNSFPRQLIAVIATHHYQKTKIKEWWDKFDQTTAQANLAAPNGAVYPTYKSDPVALEAFIKEFCAACKIKEEDFKRKLERLQVSYYRYFDFYLKPSRSQLMLIKPVSKAVAVDVLLAGLAFSLLSLLLNKKDAATFTGLLLLGCLLTHFYKLYFKRAEPPNFVVKEELELFFAGLDLAHYSLPIINKPAALKFVPIIRPKAAREAQEEPRIIIPMLRLPPQAPLTYTEMGRLVRVTRRKVTVARLERERPTPDEPIPAIIHKPVERYRLPDFSFTTSGIEFSYKDPETQARAEISLESFVPLIATSHDNILFAFMPKLYKELGESTIPGLLETMMGVARDFKERKSGQGVKKTGEYYFLHPLGDHARGDQRCCGIEAKCTVAGKVVTIILFYALIVHARDNKLSIPDIPSQTRAVQEAFNHAPDLDRLRTHQLEIEPAFG